MKRTIIQYGLFNAVLAAGYIALVATFLSSAEKIFGQQEGSPIPIIAFLLTFVFSAAIMGITIFGRSILWYLDGKKKEAIILLFYTLGFLLLIMFVVFLVLLISKY